MQKYVPVRTMEDLATLDMDQVMEGYHKAFDGYILVGDETRSFIHGWRNRMQEITGEVQEDQAELARAYVAAKRKSQNL